MMLSVQSTLGKLTILGGPVEDSLTRLSEATSIRTLNH